MSNQKDILLESLVSRLSESNNKTYENCKTITLTTRDLDNNLEELLNTIKSYSTVGHTFTVVIDPDDEEYRKQFYIDGDGCDQLYEIKVDKNY